MRAQLAQGLRASPPTLLPSLPHPHPPISALGFHLHYEGDAPHPNTTKWAVTPLAVSRTKRHLDSGLCARFWAAVDSDICKRKPYLLPKTEKAPDAKGSAGSSTIMANS